MERPGEDERENLVEWTRWLLSNGDLSLVHSLKSDIYTLAYFDRNDYAVYHGDQEQVEKLHRLLTEIDAMAARLGYIGSGRAWLGGFPQAELVGAVKRIVRAGDRDAVESIREIIRSHEVRACTDRKRNAGAPVAAKSKSLLRLVHVSATPGKSSRKGQGSIRILPKEAPETTHAYE